MSAHAYNFSVKYLSPFPNKTFVFAIDSAWIFTT